jgi:hypothetical protein
MTVFVENQSTEKSPLEEAVYEIEARETVPEEALHAPL